MKQKLSDNEAQALVVDIRAATLQIAFESYRMHKCDESARSLADAYVEHQIAICGDAKMNGPSITRRIFAVPELLSIRATVFQRDFPYSQNCGFKEKDWNEQTDHAIDCMFHKFADLTQEGETAEDALADVFGLEPDYLFDGELHQYYNGKGE
jgi:hypothetical protein